MQDFDPLNGPSINAERASRLSRGFKIARTAFAGIEASVEVPDSDELHIFDLEKELTEYTLLWDTQETVITGFVDNPTNSEMLGAAIRAINNDPSDRETRRRQQRVQNPDFKQFAAIYIISGRLHARLSAEYGASQVFSNMRHADVETMRTEKADHERSNGKRVGLLGNLPQYPEVVDFSRGLEQFKDDISSTYRPIVKIEKVIIDKAKKQITESPQKAEELIETFLQSMSVETKLERAFVGLFANEYKLEGESSTLALALASIAESGSKGLFERQFIQDKVEENTGDNWLNFVAKSHGLTGNGSKFVEFMQKCRHLWPADFTSEYAQYSENRVKQYVLSIARSSHVGMRKAWLPPDKVVYERMIDQQAKKMGLVFSKNYDRPNSDKKSSSGIEVSVTEVLGVYESKSKEPLMISTVRQNGGGLRSVSETQNVVEDLLGKSVNDRKLIDDVKKVVDRLTVDPLGSGVLNLRSIKGIKIDGKLQKVYRANPSHMTKLSISKQAKDARVVFVITNGKLSILAIPTNHADYEKTIAHLEGRR